MIYTIPSHLPELPVYKKAKEIFSLSRKISSYLNYDLSHLKEDGKEDEHIYFSGDIVQQSEALMPEIIKAEVEKYSDKKHTHTAAVKRITNLLYKNCQRLEHCNSNGREYVPLLRKELKKFRKLQRHWSLTL